MIDYKQVKRPYGVSPYDPEWAKKFEEIKRSLESTIADDSVTIEHVGSTSVPGMSAKPVIDVLVAVPDKSWLTKLKDKIANLGYEYEEDYIEPDSICFWKVDTEGRKTENIHLLLASSEKRRHFVEVTNYLRANISVAKEYSDLKLELNRRYPNDYPAYRQGKDSYLKKLEQDAEAWARNQGV